MQYQPLLPDQYFHIYNRGNNGENIFIEERNYQYFLLLISKHLLPVCNVLAYCMLKNHFHLVVKTKEKQTEKNISNAFSNLFNAYAKAINKAHNRTGSLFENRFKRIIITDEDYLKNLIIYLHLNPENHKMTDDFKNYSYSSYPNYINKKPDFLEKEIVLTLFQSLENFVAVHQSKRRIGLGLDSTIEDC
ncbi:transposase [Salinimicrobium sp. HB62]|uniref:transposase n=1 Tax=Salinimicrobium sp. HB62 TaxID=3077781 RepID=UPI002D78B010|nr:transposase [Salinimicrobium sp. HB62]